MIPLSIPRYETMTPSLFQKHLADGTPFITRDAAPSTPTVYTPDSTLSWVQEFERRGYDGVVYTYTTPWRPPPASFFEWSEQNTPSFKNLAHVVSTWPTTVYFSTVGNSNFQKSLIKEIYPGPHFLSSRDYYGVDGMWMYGGPKGTGVSNHIDTIGCVCSWSYLLFGSKLWTLSTPPGLEPAEEARVVQEEGDFFFWCVGYFHATEIMSDNALDVHGYVNLKREKEFSWTEALLGIKSEAADDEEKRRPQVYSALTEIYSQNAKLIPAADKDTDRSNFYRWMPIISASCNDVNIGPWGLSYTFFRVAGCGGLFLLLLLAVSRRILRKQRDEKSAKEKKL